MTEQQTTPGPTEQEAADALYETAYGAPRLPEFSPEHEDLYNQYFPNN